MTDKIYEAEHASARCEGYMHARALHLQTLAHWPLDLVKQTSLRELVQLFGETMLGFVVLDVEEHLILIFRVK